MADHFNAEVVAGTIASAQDAMDYLTWTFFYHRLLQNPSYYDLEATGPDDVSAFLSRMVEKTLAMLQVQHSQLIVCLRTCLHAYALSTAFPKSNGCSRLIVP